MPDQLRSHEIHSIKYKRLGISENEAKEKGLRIFIHLADADVENANLTFFDEQIADHQHASVPAINVITTALLLSADLETASTE